MNDLVRIAVVPAGAEVTGAIATPDGKTLLFNSQHPSSSNPFPYNHSLTMAITGFDQITDLAVSVPENGAEDGSLNIYPNPVSRTLHLSEQTDIALYDMAGKRIRVYRNIKSIDVSEFTPGLYFVRTETGETKKLIIE